MLLGRWWRVAISGIRSNRSLGVWVCVCSICCSADEGIRGLEVLLVELTFS
jgi:hypothetical protein